MAGVSFGIRVRVSRVHRNGKIKTDYRAYRLNIEKTVSSNRELISCVHRLFRVLTTHQQQ